MGKMRRISEVLVTVPEDGREQVRCLRRTPEYPEPGRRILAHFDMRGLWFYCRFCKMEHALDWDALFAERLRLEEEGGTGRGKRETSR